MSFPFLSGFGLGDLLVTFKLLVWLENELPYRQHKNVSLEEVCVLDRNAQIKMCTWMTCTETNQDTWALVPTRNRRYIRDKELVKRNVNMDLHIQRPT